MPGLSTVWNFVIAASQGVLPRDLVQKSLMGMGIDAAEILR